MSTDDIKRHQINLRDELDGSALYTSIAAAERDRVLLQLRFGQLYYVYVVITLVLGTYLTYGGLRGQISTAARR
jgi:hypothetical protein